MDCGFILYWVLFVCVLFGIVDIVMGMLFCNFCGPHCCCTAFCLAALFSLSSLVRLFLPCCGFSVFFGKWKNGFKLSLIKNGGVVFKYVLKFSELSCLWSMTDYGGFIAKVFYCLAWWYFFSCSHCCQTSSQTVMLPSVLGCLWAGWHKVREPGNRVPR